MPTEDDDDKTTETTFTKAQFARELNKQVRAKVAEALEGYGDLEELKRKAATADKQQTSIDKMAEQLDALTKRAETAEIDVARTKVAEKLGLTTREAGRLKGKTFDELLADGEELVEDLGIDTAARKRGDKGKASSKDGDEQETTDDDTGKGDDDEQQEQQQERERPPRRRPRELRSGGTTSSSRGEAEERDPLKLIAGVPRG